MTGFLLSMVAAFLLVSPTEVDLSPAALLPPDAPWDGASRRLIAPADSDWMTPSEASNLLRTPSYDETFSWLSRLEGASSRLQRISLGQSAEGRHLFLIVASKEGARTPEELRANGRPTLFAQGGIHSGEIDGKDAGLMLLRDLTVTGKLDLLDRANLLFLPIFNVDGHERSSSWHRMNQRGPEEMGWRTNARNLNLNRDYSKLDTPEMRALVQAIDRWQPDLYLDLHVTDGADYQYDITFGWNGPHAYSPAIAGWLDEIYRPTISAGLRREAHVPGPLVFLKDRTDPAQGIWGWTASPRYSNGWGDARHLPTVLVENHSLKPYDRRVLGTYVLLRDTLELLGQSYESLRKAVDEDRNRHPKTLTLTWEVPASDLPTMVFLGIEAEVELSPISGSLREIWTGRETTLRVPVHLANQPVVTVPSPRAYWLPPAWSHVVELLELQGIEVERRAEEREVEVEMYRLLDAELETEPFEGRVRVTATPEVEQRLERFPAGSFRVATAQPLGQLAMLLLEPESPDSFFQWGFFLEVLQRTEYAEAYVMEPLAAKMLAADPKLEARFQKALAGDEELRMDPVKRLRWFYEQTPYYDSRYLLYPVAREIGHD